MRDAYQLLKMRIRQRLQQNAFKHAENNYIGADAAARVINVTP